MPQTDNHLTCQGEICNDFRFFSNGHLAKLVLQAAGLSGTCASLPKKKGPRILLRTRGALEETVRAALLSRALEHSIIAAGGLNGRVRDGNGCHTPAGGTNQGDGSGQVLSARRSLQKPSSSAAFAGPAWAPHVRPRCPANRASGADGAQASRPIRSGMVNASRRLRIRPVERVVFPWPSGASRPGTARLRGGLALRCVQRLSLRGVATRRCPWQDSRNTRGRPPPVLSY